MTSSRVHTAYRPSRDGANLRQKIVCSCICKPRTACMCRCYCRYKCHFRMQKMFRIPIQHVKTFLLLHFIDDRLCLTRDLQLREQICFAVELPHTLGSSYHTANRHNCLRLPAELHCRVQDSNPLSKTSPHAVTPRQVPCCRRWAPGEAGNSFRRPSRGETLCYLCDRRQVNEIALRHVSSDRLSRGAGAEVPVRYRR